MPDSNIHVGDVGTELVCQLVDQDGDVVDLSAAGTMRIFLGKPGGSVLTKAAVLDTDGTDGRMKYLTIDGDVDEAGVWEIQGRAAIGSYRYSTSKGSFTVVRNTIDVEDDPDL